MDSEGFCSLSYRLCSARSQVAAVLWVQSSLPPPCPWGSLLGSGNEQEWGWWGEEGGLVGKYRMSTHISVSTEDRCLLSVNHRDAEVTGKASGGGGQGSKDPTQLLERVMGPSQRKEVAEGAHRPEGPPATAFPVPSPSPRFYRTHPCWRAPLLPVGVGSHTWKMTTSSSKGQGALWSC